jgi:hypothetical protein
VCFIRSISRRYHQQYNYSGEHYGTASQHQTRATAKIGKRGATTKTMDRSQHKRTSPIRTHATMSIATIATTSTNNNNNHHLFRHQSASDNDQKEGEEWETASESSTNMRNGHHDNNQVLLVQPIKSNMHETQIVNRDRTPPKKSFFNQRQVTVIESNRSIFIA